MSGIKINITSHPNALNGSPQRSYYGHQPYSSLTNGVMPFFQDVLGSGFITSASGGRLSTGQFIRGTRSDGSTWYSDYLQGSSNSVNPDDYGVAGMMYVYKTYTCPANMIFVGKAILSVSMVAGSVTVATSYPVPHTGLAAADDFIITKFHERDGSGTAIVQDFSTQYAELPIYLNAGESITLKVVGTTVFQASAYLCGTTTAV
jgi:hypothetical protein